MNKFKCNDYVRYIGPYAEDYGGELFQVTDLPNGHHDTYICRYACIRRYIDGQERFIGFKEDEIELVTDTAEDCIKKTTAA